MLLRYDSAQRQTVKCACAGTLFTLALSCMDYFALLKAELKTAFRRPLIELISISGIDDFAAVNRLLLMLLPLLWAMLFFALIVMISFLASAYNPLTVKILYVALAVPLAFLPSDKRSRLKISSMWDKDLFANSAITPQGLSLIRYVLCGSGKFFVSYFLLTSLLAASFWIHGTNPTAYALLFLLIFSYLLAIMSVNTLFAGTLLLLKAIARPPSATLRKLFAGIELSILFALALLASTHIKTLFGIFLANVDSAVLPNARMANVLMHMTNGNVRDGALLAVSFSLFSVTSFSLSYLLFKRFSWHAERDNMVPFSPIRTTSVKPRLSSEKHAWLVLLRKDMVQFGRAKEYRETFSFLLVSSLLFPGILISTLFLKAPLRFYSSWSALYFLMIAPMGVISFASLGFLSFTSFDRDGEQIQLVYSSAIGPSYVLMYKTVLHALALVSLSSLVCFALLLKVKPEITGVLFVFVLLCALSFLAAVLSVGSTALFPRISWKHTAEIGGTYKARLAYMLSFGVIELLTVTPLTTMTQATIGGHISKATFWMASFTLVFSVFLASLFLFRFLKTKVATRGIG